MQGRERPGEAGCRERECVCALIEWWQSFPNSVSCGCFPRCHRDEYLRPVCMRGDSGFYRLPVSTSLSLFHNARERGFSTIPNPITSSRSSLVPRLPFRLLQLRHSTVPPLLLPSLYFVSFIYFLSSVRGLWFSWSVPVEYYIKREKKKRKRKEGATATVIEYH